MEYIDILVVLFQLIPTIISVGVLYFSIVLFRRAEKYRMINKIRDNESALVTMIGRFAIYVTIITIFYIGLSIQWVMFEYYLDITSAVDIAWNLFESMVMVLLGLSVFDSFKFVKGRAEFKNQKIIYDMLNSQMDLLVCIDNNNDIIFANKAFLNLFGISEDNIKHGFDVTTIFEYEDIEPITKKWIKIRKPPYRKKYQQKLKTPKGRIWYDWDAWCLFNDKNNIIGIALAARDITKDKKKQDMMLKKKDYLNEILESSPDCIFRVNMDHIIKYANEAYKKTFFGDEDPIGRKTLNDNVHPEDIEIVKNSNEKVKYTPHTDKAKYRLRIKNGEYRWFEVYRIGIPDDFGEIVQVQCIARDITDDERSKCL